MITNHIINNFKGSDINDYINSIEESIKENDEITLPGLGVFFEILWKNSDESSKLKIVDTIKKFIN